MASVTPLRLLALVLVMTGVIGLSAPGSAMAAKQKSCLERIIDDWYPNERIDGHYSQQCYREAEQNMPQDLRDYSDLPAELARARNRDLRQQPADPGQDARRVASSGSGPVDARNDNDDSGSANSGGPIGEFLDAAGPSSADSAPIPLLILAGLALLLVAAGAAGILSRKLHARRARTTPHGTPDA